MITLFLDNLLPIIEKFLHIKNFWVVYNLILNVISLINLNRLFFDIILTKNRFKILNKIYLKYIFKYEFIFKCLFATIKIIFTLNSNFLN